MSERRGATGAPNPALRVTRNLVIPLDELQWRFSTSGGPGGQHANRSNTRVEVRFDVERSGALGPRQRARLLERLGPTVRAVSADQRSQARNRDIALSRLRIVWPMHCTWIALECPPLRPRHRRSGASRRSAAVLFENENELYR